MTRDSADLTKREVLDSVIASPGSTRSSISKRSGLAASAVGRAVASLIADGSVAESRQPKGPGSGSGRPAKTLVPVLTPRDGAPTASIDFGHSHVGVALGDEFGRLGACRRIDFDVAADAHRALDLAADTLAALRTALDVGRPPVVVCGVPASVDTRAGTILAPSILPGWTGIRPSDELQRRLHTTVRTETDTMLGALGELRAGAGRSRTDFLYIKVSGGIGASLVVNGDVYRGASGLAGKIGHMHVAGHDEPCRCGGRGCLEAVVGLSAIGMGGEELPATPRDPNVPGTLSAKAPAGVLRQAGSALGTAVAGICSLLNPTAVIVGGSLAIPGGEFLEGLRAAVAHHSPPAARGNLEIVPAGLGGRSGLIGGLQLARELHRAA
jgi:predicted NBD/HSP70 family sugar kinase